MTLRPTSSESFIRHFDLELAELRRSLVTMGNLVERSTEIATNAILVPEVDSRDKARVIEDQLDTLESAIEDRCHQLIALQSPLAGDLRLVIAAMRITTDLEQVGDNAESVAKRASWIARHERIENPPQLAELCKLVRAMIRQSLESFLSGSPEVAKAVIIDEDQADDLTKECYEAIQAAMAARPTRIREYTHLLRAVAHLENMADIAVSIAEEGVYIHQGRLIRHSHDALSI